MKAIIEDIIAKKPHLKDPFRLYEKCLKFIKSVHGLLLAFHTGEGPAFSDLKAYPPESVAPVFRQLTSILELPEGSLTPLQQAMETGDIDFTRLPLHEVPAFSLPYAENELATLLFLLSKPFFLRLGDMLPLDNRFWEEGRCPLCKARPSMGSVAKEGSRRLFCSFCGTAGYYAHIGCPICLNDDSGKMNVFTFEGEEEFSVDACDACGSYIKAVDGDMPDDMTPDVADLASLPLDIVMQAKGYVRHSPNPLGLITMIER